MLVLEENDDMDIEWLLLKMPLVCEWGVAGCCGGGGVDRMDTGFLRGTS